jgi:hypothetical protein
MLIVVFFFFPLVGVVGDPPSHCELDIGGPRLAFLMLAIGRNPFGHNLHVDHRLPFPSSWLQLLATLLVIMILMVCVLHLLCL